MSAETRRSLFILSTVTVISVLIGVIISLDTWRSVGGFAPLLQGAATGVFIGLGCSSVELFVLSRTRVGFVRRMPPLAMLVLRGVSYSLFIVIGVALPDVIAGVPTVWGQPGAGQTFAVSFVVSLAVSTGFELVRLLGREAVVSLLTTRYNAPRLEDRVVMFADLVGSTALAERLGDVQFHRFLSDVALDLSDPILTAGGDVHRYVGDAVIVTWPFHKGVRKAACLTCARQMHAVLAARSAWYDAQYGAAPRLRIAVHGGPVAAGEIGGWKKEIALLGDTMNTAARIEGAARVHGCDTVLSDAVVAQFPVETVRDLTALPPFSAAGKKDDLAIWADCAPNAVV